MVGKEITDGTWVTALTPFDSEHRVDYNALGALIEWYIQNGIDGIFAVCQSSEMFFLTAEESEKIARFVVEKVNGRVQVVVSGHVSDDTEDQISELKRMEACESDAVVLVTNRLAKENESEEVWKRNAEKIFKAMPDCRFGLYECPTPYKRVLSPELLKWCAESGQVVFLKDTCCDFEQIKAKLEAVKGKGLKLFNANAATLLDSMRAGASGYCGIMLNFFPKLYKSICSEYDTNPEKAEYCQLFSTVTALIELQLYPINAKYHLSKLGLPIQIYTRSRDDTQWNKLRELETDSLQGLYEKTFDF